MERNTLEYVVAAITGAIIFALIGAWSSSVNERETARDCDLMGVAMLNGKPYKCSRIVPTPNPTEVPGRRALLASHEALPGESCALNEWDDTIDAQQQGGAE